MFLHVNFFVEWAEELKKRDWILGRCRSISFHHCIQTDWRPSKFLSCEYQELLHGGVVYFSPSIAEVKNVSCIYSIEIILYVL